MLLKLRFNNKIISKNIAYLFFYILNIFILTNFNIWDLKGIDIPLGDLPFKPLLILLYIDYSDVKFWQFFLLSVAVISIVLYFYADHIKITKIDSDLAISENDTSIRIIVLLNNFRNIMSFLYFVSAFIILCVYFEVWEYKYVPYLFKDLLITLKSYINL